MCNTLGVFGTLAGDSDDQNFLWSQWPRPQKSALSQSTSQLRLGVASAGPWSYDWKEQQELAPTAFSAGSGSAGSEQMDGPWLIFNASLISARVEINPHLRCSSCSFAFALKHTAASLKGEVFGLVSPPQRAAEIDFKENKKVAEEDGWPPQA